MPVAPTSASTRRIDIPLSASAKALLKRVAIMCEGLVRLRIFDRLCLPLQRLAGRRGYPKIMGAIELPSLVTLEPPLHRLGVNTKPSSSSVQRPTLCLKPSSLLKLKRRELPMLPDLYGSPPKSQGHGFPVDAPSLGELVGRGAG